MDIPALTGAGGSVLMAAFSIITGGVPFASSPNLLAFIRAAPGSCFGLFTAGKVSTGLDEGRL